ncbi:hypothetical protein HPP92_023611 [Vanilla planifolia]|uniref:Uncharacterized protein n=1 Tax=Vanilla planifolia TaxID=51239 RepID=A0A835UAY8_VANPL|nr:hypothetical protein HPP92_023920 [Vanilla planifolia]KAG0455823.1 hypothetical protein HPP92_023611 [Vanilla planifolia]
MFRESPWLFRGGVGAVDTTICILSLYREWFRYVHARPHRRGGRGLTWDNYCSLFMSCPWSSQYAIIETSVRDMVDEFVYQFRRIICSIGRSSN